MTCIGDIIFGLRSNNDIVSGVITKLGGGIWIDNEYFPTQRTSYSREALEARVTRSINQRYCLHKRISICDKDSRTVSCLFCNKVWMEMEVI